MKLISSMFFWLLVRVVAGQNVLLISALDSMTHEPIAGAIIVSRDHYHGAVTNGAGQAILHDLLPGDRFLHVSALGYAPAVVTLRWPRADTAVWVVYLNSVVDDLKEIVVFSTRTNSRLEDSPQKIKVLNQGDMYKESGMVPGNMSGIFGDLAVITIQRTELGNGNDAVRMQGLDPQYTQLLRDGAPVYNGFSGRISVLSNPPLDLQQVEIIKGPVPTLYGGGAIAGLINFVSKTPGRQPQRSFLLNYTTLQEWNANTFWARQKGRWGYTFFAGWTSKKGQDINKDYFTEVPENRNFILHPRMFVTLNARSKLNVGLTSVSDRRRSGDIEAVQNGVTDQYPYLHAEHSRRSTLDLAFNHDFSVTNDLQIKAVLGMFQREETVKAYRMAATQYSTYVEATNRLRVKSHALLMGATLVNQSFRLQPGVNNIRMNNSDYLALGVFLQDDWTLGKRVTLEGGLRFDLLNSDRGFLLPRLALLYKPTPHWSFRLAGGAGYKAPDILAFTRQASNFIHNNWREVQAEHSLGINAAVDFHALWFDRVGVEFSQAFYFTQINDPVALAFDFRTALSSLQNGDFRVRSYSADTYCRLTFKGVEFYLGYNHTDALQVYASRKVPLSYQPRTKFCTTLAYEIPNRWRIGVERRFNGIQHVYYVRIPGFWLVAAMVERKFSWGSLVLHGENLTDSRQSRQEPLVGGTRMYPGFDPIWGPMEGRVLNLSIKVHW